MKRQKYYLKVVGEDGNGEPFLIMSIRDAISREVCDFMDLVPNKEDALHLIFGAIERGTELYRERKLPRSDVTRIKDSAA